MVVANVSRERDLSGCNDGTVSAQHILEKYIEDDTSIDMKFPRERERYRNVTTRLRIDLRTDPGTVEVSTRGSNVMHYGFVEAVERVDVPVENSEFGGFG